MFQPSEMDTQYFQIIKSISSGLREMPTKFDCDKDIILIVQTIK